MEATIKTTRKRYIDIVFKKLIDDMSRHAQKDYPLECCGIITSGFEYIPCQNVSTSPKNSFILNPIDLLEYEEYTWGIFHSHPGSDNPLPSEEDIKHTVFDEYKFIVGFADKFYIYWYDHKINALKYEIFSEEHLIGNKNQSKIS